MRNSKSRHSRKQRFCQCKIFRRSSGLLRLKYGVFRASGLYNHGDYILRHIE